MFEVVLEVSSGIDGSQHRVWISYTPLPKTIRRQEVSRIDHQYSIDWESRDCRLERVVRAGTNPAQRYIADRIASTDEFDRTAYIVERLRRKDLTIWPARPRIAVAETGYIQAQRRVAAARPCSR
jgi:hypothetical protein